MTLEEFMARYRISDETLRRILPKGTLSRWRHNGLPETAVTILKILEQSDH